MDIENPLFGSSACGVYWSAYSLTSGSEEPIEILIHNPHNFGNETAIDELLANTALWSGLEFEKGILESGEFQRNTGLFFIIVALVVMGIALFSTLIYNKNDKLLWIFGMVILFAGTYLAYSAYGISFWRDSMPVPADKLVAVYRNRIPNMGNVAMFMQTTTGLIVCVVCPILLLVGYDMIRRRKYEKSSKEDTDALLRELEELRAQKAAKEQEK